MLHPGPTINPPAALCALPTDSIAVHGLINGNERGVKGVKLLTVVGTSMSKGFLDNGVPEVIKGRNILGQRLRPGVFKEKQIL